MSLIKHFVNFLLFSFGSIKPITGPLRVHWDITELCNSRCRHCVRWKIKKSKVDLSFEECCKVIDGLREVGTKSISFAGNEPLMRKDIYELVKYANKLGFGTSINTNGLLLNKENTATLIRNGLGSFIFSLDSCERKTHDFLRGVPGNFDKIFKAVGLIRDVRKRLKKNIGIQVTTVISKKNLHEVYDIVKLCKGRGIDRIILQPVHNVKEFFESEESLLLKQEDIGEMKKQLEMVERDFGDFIASPREYLENFTTFIQNPKKLFKYRCAAAFITVDIRPNGDVVPCPVGFVKIGNLRESSFKEIWFSEKADEIRKKIKENKHPICWFSCIQPINIISYNTGRFKVFKVFDTKFLRHAFSKIK